MIDAGGDVMTVLVQTVIIYSNRNMYPKRNFFFRKRLSVGFVPFHPYDQWLVAEEKLKNVLPDSRFQI